MDGFGSNAYASPDWLRRGQDLVLPLAIIASVLVILVPLPPALLDVLLAANITLSVIVLLTTIYVRTPLEFSIFPTLLLATTLARLVLNVATTRLILTHGAKRQDGRRRRRHHGLRRVRRRRRKIVVGIIIFVIIVVIQFVVITKGATRISEVAARFALDGMPGKQMAIDADLNAGIIDEKRSPAPPRGNHPAGRLLRRHGRCQQVRPRRRHRRHRHHAHQHRRRPDHRRRRARHAARPRRPACSPS